MFRDREDAGNHLARELAKYRGENAVILALPRGGVVVGARIAEVLDLPLDIVVVRKIGHPDNPEYAVCAVDEGGTLLCDEEAVRTIPKDWLEGEALREQNEALRRTRVYQAGRSKTEIEGKIAVLVDDGIATGLTVRAAIGSIKKQNPKKIIIAVPVAPHDVVMKLKKEADEVIVLLDPLDFLGAVGAHYQYFPQVSDQEVIALLK